MAYSVVQIQAQLAVRRARAEFRQHLTRQPSPPPSVFLVMPLFRAEFASQGQGAAGVALPVQQKARCQQDDFAPTGRVVRQGGGVAGKIPFAGQIHARQEFLEGTMGEGEAAILILTKLPGFRLRGWRFLEAFQHEIHQGIPTVEAQVAG